MGLAENIRAARQARGMTQQELADRLDLTPNAVTMWESGRSKPRTAMMPLLAEILGTTTGDLLGEDAGLRSGVRMPLYGWTHAGEPMEEIAGDDYAYVPPIVAQNHPRGAFYTPLTCGYAPMRDSYPKRKAPPTRRRGAHARPWLCDGCRERGNRSRWSTTGRAPDGG